MSKKRERKRDASAAVTGRAPVRPAAAPAAVSRSNPGWWTAALAVLLVVLTLVVFAPLRHFDFVEMDDPSYVFENPQVLAGLTPQSVAWAFTTGHAGFWIPAVWLSYMVDIEVFGRGPHGHHVTNLVLHTLASLLLFGWLARATRSPGRSFAVAALFAVHPLHVESVAWITERKDVLSGVFFMLALWAYASYARRPVWWRYALVALMFLLGLMSKPMVVTLPIVLLMIDVWPLGRLTPPRTLLSLLWEKLPLVALAVGSSVVTFFTQMQQGAVSNLTTVTPSFRISNALVSYAEYLRMAVWPAGLSFFYPMPQRIPAWQAIGAVVLLVGVTAAVSVRWRRRPWLLVGWLWYVVTLVPVIGLVQVGVQARADRFMYLPAIGLFVMAAWGVAGAVPRRRWHVAVLAIAAVVAVAAYSLVASAQVWYWRDSTSLYTRTSMAGLHQDEYSAHVQLGVALRNKGRLEEAAVHFARAIELKPEAADPHVELGLTLTAQGKMEPAVAQYVEAIRLQPGQADAHNNLGALLTEQGKFDEAIRELREAVRISPDFEGAHVNLGLAFIKADRPAESIPEFREALRLNPNDAIAKRAVEGLTAAKK
jgi:Tfp pilus assembly protein PilF